MLAKLVALHQWLVAPLVKWPKEPREASDPQAGRARVARTLARQLPASAAVVVVLAATAVHGQSVVGGLAAAAAAEAVPPAALSRLPGMTSAVPLAAAEEGAAVPLLANLEAREMLHDPHSRRRSSDKETSWFIASETGPRLHFAAPGSDQKQPG